MALTSPDLADLALFMGVVTIEDQRAPWTLQIATDLMGLATGLTEDYPTDSPCYRIVKAGTMDMAWALLVGLDNREESYTPFQSERIGSYSYSKAAQAIQQGTATGVQFFDLAVASCGYGTASDGTGATDVAWTTAERVFDPLELGFWVGLAYEDPKWWVGAGAYHSVSHEIPYYPVSYSSLLKHQFEVERLFEGQIDGMPTHEWSVVAVSQPGFLDLNYIRRGKDPQWTPEAGRPQDRTGVLFTRWPTPIRSGDRVRMTRGPVGTFMIEGAVDEAWKPERGHHVEVGVKEVPRQITAGQDY